MPTYCFREIDPPEGAAPRERERSYTIASCPEEIEVDGVRYARVLDVPDWIQEIRDREPEGSRGVRQVTSLPQRMFQGDEFSSIQIEPGAGLDKLSQVPRSKRWSYDAEGVPVFTSQAQLREFVASSEGDWAWDRDSRRV